MDRWEREATATSSAPSGAPPPGAGLPAAGGQLSGSLRFARPAAEPARRSPAPARPPASIWPRLDARGSGSTWHFLPIQGGIFQFSVLSGEP